MAKKMWAHQGVYDVKQLEDLGYKDNPRFYIYPYNIRMFENLKRYDHWPCLIKLKFWWEGKNGYNFGDSKGILVF